MNPDLPENQQYTRIRCESRRAPYGDEVKNVECGSGPTGKKNDRRRLPGWQKREPYNGKREVSFPGMATKDLNPPMQKKSIKKKRETCMNGERKSVKKNCRAGAAQAPTDQEATK